MSFVYQSNKVLLCLLLMFFIQFVSAQTVNKLHWDGKIFLKLKSTSQAQLPQINSKSELTPQYPYFNDLFRKFKTNKVFRPYTHLKSSSFQDLYQVEFEGNTKIEDFIRDLKANDMVEYAEPIPIDQVLLSANDQYSGQQWHLEKIQAYEAWDIATGSEDVVVAIIDDAIQTTHEDLTNTIWTNINEIPNNGVDDDNNGYIDDYQGWDIADNDNNPNPPAGSSYLRHGTHVTGIVAAQTNNSIGVASIGNGIKVLPIKATQDEFGTSTQITHGWQGVSYAIAMGVDIINLSWGSKASSQTYQSIIDDAHAQGIIIVAAAGNSNNTQKFYPAAYNNVVSVAATDHSDHKMGVSNYGDWIDISAPGSTIISTGSMSNDAYESNSGTSMASPLVAGLIGLMKSYDNSSSADDILACLLSNTDPIQDTDHATSMGTGRINAYEAMNCLLAANCKAPNAPTADQLSPTTATITWKNSNNNNFQIAYKLTTASKWTFVNSTGLSISLEELQPNRTYHIKVASICGETTSDYSPVVEFKTKEINCEAPIDINFKNISTQQVRIGWSIEDDTYTDSYTFRYKKKNASNWTSITINESPIFINNLEQEQSYELQIACNCVGTQSEYSKTVSFDTKTPHELTLEGGSTNNLDGRTTLDGRAELEEEVIVGLQSYPNPTNGILFIEFFEEEATNKVIRVYNMTGKMVHQQAIDAPKGTNRHKIDLSKKTAGRYIVEVSGTNQSLKQSIILY